MKNPPEHLKSILWEYDSNELDCHHPVVLERVLLLGNKEDIAYVGLTRLKEFFMETKPQLDQKSYNFWCAIFGVEKDSSPPSFYDILNTPTFQRSFR